jgi:YfiH family protein
MIEGWLEADWPAPPGVRAGTTTRRFLGVSQPPFDRANFGTRCGDHPEAVARNRTLLRETLVLPSEPRWLHQVHGIAVAVVVDALAAPSCDAAEASLWERAPLATGTAMDASGPDAAAGSPPIEPQADAAVTRTPGVVLAILTADCLPVVFASDDGAVIAAAHAGWRGLAAGVLEATIDAMAVDPAQVNAWLGPAAGPRAYEVGDEVRAAFVDRDAEAAAAFACTRPGHWLCDLYALARRRLAARGVSRVSGGTHCTISDRERFYSHRRDQRTGRMVTVAWIVPAAGALRPGA